MSGLSPRPWRWDCEFPGNTRALDDAKGEGVLFHRAEWPVKSANADFIVRACNAHEELVGALKAALPWVQHYEEGGKAAAMILDAIAKAEGK